MKTLYTLLLGSVLFTCVPLRAQDPDGFSWMNYYRHDGLTELPDETSRQGDPSVLDGNGTLGSIFDTTLCGLNYVQRTVKLGQRLTPPGVVQPAQFPISGMPSCGPVVKAYLWCMAVGTGIPVTATISNPAGGTANFLMTVVGQGPDLCWGSGGTYIYRADVTSIISGNGNYIISGLPTTTTFSATANDVDGATLFIMYQDLSATYTGSIHISDGAIPVLGGTATSNMTGFNSCGTSTAGSAFMIAGDLQMNGAQYSMNGSPTATYPTFNWFDFISQSTSVTSGQSSANFTLTASGDCFCLAVAGLYWQTSCLTCNASSGGLTLTQGSITPATCGANGAASVNVSGGSGNYIITWSTFPQQTGTSASNLAGGTYTITALDTVADMCGTLTITVPYNGPVLTTSATPVNCAVNGSATANISGGTPPYTYSWAPSGGTNATANNLTAGTYTVTVTDGSGCTLTATAIVGNSSVMNVFVTTVADSCPSPAGAAYSNVSGGVTPYTYSWAPGGQTTSSITNVASGSYTLTVTDATGCVVSTMVNIPMNNISSQVSVQPVAPVTCGAWVQLQASTNISPATFSWQPTTYLSTPNSATTWCNPYSNITYTVTATSSCGSDTAVVSVVINTTFALSEPICEVTVDTSIHRCVVAWQHTTTPGWGFFTIYRETATPGVYNPIATQHAGAPTAYTDWSSAPWFGTDRYKITFTDSCGTQSTLGVAHRTMFLQATPAAPGYNLTWSAYEGFNVNGYTVLRGSGIGNMSAIATVSASTFSYSDPNPPAGPVYYVIEAQHPGGGCSTGSSTYTYVHSNIWSSTWVGMEENELQSSLMMIPNPGNGIFVLNCNAGSGNDVAVTITDALGRIVYTSVDANQSGTFRKEMDLSFLAAGVYNVHVNNGTSEGITQLVITE